MHICSQVRCIIATTDVLFNGVYANGENRVEITLERTAIVQTDVKKGI